MKEIKLQAYIPPMGDPIKGSGLDGWSCKFEFQDKDKNKMPAVMGCRGKLLELTIKVIKEGG